MEAASQYPGRAWLVGNEPDTSFEGQDSLTPDEYALAYRNIYRLLKRVDPAAQVGIGTIVQPTPLRLQWLEAVWAAYRARYHTSPPSDFWSIHSFILREKQNDWGTGIPPGVEAAEGELYTIEQTDDLEIFKSRLLDFRRWLAAHGERGKAVWITEYGSLLPHDGRGGFVTQPMERVRDYMLATFDFLLGAQDPAVGNPHDDNRLVQRWFWYSLDDHLWRFGGSLFDPETGGRTLLGDAFAQYVAAVPAQPSVWLMRPSNGAIASWPRTRDGKLLARVTVINSGNAPTSGPLVIAWHNGDPLAGGQRLAESIIAAPLPGCGSTQTVSAWLSLPANLDGWLYAALAPAGSDRDGLSVLPLSRWQLRPAPSAK